MNILGWIGIIFGIFTLVTTGIFLYDQYQYPVCPRCGDNSVTKRIKGKVICWIHGEGEI